MPVNIVHLFVMRVGESVDGRLTKRGFDQTRFMATEIEKTAGNCEDAALLCSPESHVAVAAREIAQVLGVDFDMIVYLPVGLELGSDKSDEAKLDLIHKTVMNNQRPDTIIVLPHNLAESYPLHFLLTEHLGAPDPRLRNVLAPGEVVDINCHYGRRSTITLPGNSPLEQMFRRR